MYDNVCKFLAESFSEDFSAWLIGKPIHLTELKPSELSLEPIRADSVIFLRSEELILHIEFQTEPDETMAFRMADYRLRLYRRFPDKEVYQVVIYLRRSNSSLVKQDTFRLRTMTHSFDVVRLWEEPTEKFLKSQGLWPFAVLSQTVTPVKILNQVAMEIKQVKNRRVQANLSATTSILAGLLLNQQEINRILRSEIMKESVIYQEILAEGLAEGKREGLATGKLKTARHIALNLLRLGMSIDQVAQATELSLEEVQVLSSEQDSSELS
jgi:predicted transposase/invertase (TIGR01784 family)